MELLLLTKVYWQLGDTRPSSLIARRGNHGMSKRKAPSMATTSLRLYVDMLQDARTTAYFGGRMAMFQTLGMVVSDRSKEG